MRLNHTPVWVLAVRIVVRQRRVMAARVPFLAVHRAGVAADAGVEVDDEAELFRSRQRLRQASHSRCLSANFRFAPKRKMWGRLGLNGGVMGGMCGNVSLGLRRRAALDAYGQIEPRRLTGYRIGLEVRLPD